MFSKKEVKDLIKRLSNHWLFPDFTNKLTWLIASIGVAIVSTPTAFKEILYNFLVDTINLNSGKHFTLAELEATNTSPYIGLTLIALALAHNLANKFLTQKSLEFVSEESRLRKQADLNLFQRFLSDFPSNGRSILFLRDHDLGGSYHENNLTDIDEFVDNWDNVEHHFLDTEIEAKRAELWFNCRRFTYDLAMHSYDLHGGPMFTCIPDNCRGAWDYPPHVEAKLKSLNESASECYKLHQEFVFFTRTKLSC